MYNLSMVDRILYAHLEMQPSQKRCLLHCTRASDMEILLGASYGVVIQPWQR